jgi:hypothetical protein
VNARLFWTSLVVQAAVLAVPFVVLGLALDESFFEDWGWVAGPAVWLVAAALTARILSMPAGYVLFSAVAGGVAGAIVFLVASHSAGMVAGLLVFAASCGSYDPEAEAEAQREHDEQRRARTERKRARGAPDGVGGEQEREGAAAK